MGPEHVRVAAMAWRTLARLAKGGVDMGEEGHAAVREIGAVYGTWLLRKVGENERDGT